MNDSSSLGAKELARRFVEALGGTKPKEALQLFAEDAWIHTTGSSHLSGIRNLKDFTALLRSAASVIPGGLRFEIKRLIGEGDQAACEVMGQAVAADGRPYNNHYVFWVQASGGRITRLSEFMDTRLVDEIFKPVI